MNISAVGPVTVDPDVQNSGIGARLMRAAIERSAAKGFAGIRLLQAGYHSGVHAAAVRALILASRRRDAWLGGATAAAGSHPP